MLMILQNLLVHSFRMLLCVQGTVWKSPQAALGRHAIFGPEFCNTFSELFCFVSGMQCVDSCRTGSSTQACRWHAKPLSRKSLSSGQQLDDLHTQRNPDRQLMGADRKKLCCCRTRRSLLYSTLHSRSESLLICKKSQGAQHSGKRD